MKVYEQRMRDEGKTTPCKWCGEETPMIGTKSCDRCWELNTRILRSPKLAAKMLLAYLEDV